MAKKDKPTPTNALYSSNARMMFKTTLRNHIDLTNIADGKANIMLSINALIITIAMPLLISEVEKSPYLIMPIGLLLLTCVLSIIFAALATRPIKTNGVTPLDKVKNTGSNIFFFGNFHNMKIEDYHAGLKEVLADEKVLEQSIFNDLYYLGLALGKKFELLRICYMVFMIGIVLSALSFVLVMWMVVGA